MDDPRSVLIRCSEALYRKDEHPRFFCRLHLFYLADLRVENPLDLPTWVPFGSDNRLYPAELKLPDTWKPHASGCDPQAPILIDFDSKVLLVGGCLVDSIADLTPKSLTDMLVSSTDVDKIPRSMGVRVPQAGRNLHHPTPLLSRVLWSEADQKDI